VNPSLLLDLNSKTDGGSEKMAKHKFDGDWRYAEVDFADFPPVKPNKPTMLGKMALRIPNDATGVLDPSSKHGGANLTGNATTDTITMHETAADHDTVYEGHLIKPENPTTWLLWEALPARTYPSRPRPLRKRLRLLKTRESGLSQSHSIRALPLCYQPCSLMTRLEQDMIRKALTSVVNPESRLFDREKADHSSSKVLDGHNTN